MSEFEKSEELVVGIYDRGLLRFGDFEWTLKPRPGEEIGRQSPVYYNQRPLGSFKNGLEVHGKELSILQQRRLRDIAVEGISWAIDELGAGHEHLYGIPQAGTAFGAMVASYRGSSYLWGRVGEKTYGAHAKIEGDYNNGDRTVDIDDVMTSFGSKQESADDKSEAGLITAGFVAMFDREEGGMEAAHAAGYQIVVVSGLIQAMEVLRTNSRIGQQEFDWVEQYRETLRTDGIIH